MAGEPVKAFNVYVPGPGSKSTVSLKKPVTYMFDVPSNAMQLGLSVEIPPNDFAQTKLPLASNLEIKISKPPTEVRLVVPGPGSKSGFLVKYHAVKTFPLASAFTDTASSILLSPIVFTQLKEGICASNIVDEKISNNNTSLVLRVFHFIK
jgi:hypothetical protein